MLLGCAEGAAPYRRAFTEALRDEVPLIRAAALESLTTLSGQGAIPTARKLLQDPHGLVRAEAVSTFVNTGSQLPNSRIRKLVHDEDSLVRFQAVQAAGADMKEDNWAYKLLSTRFSKERDQSISAVILESLFRTDANASHLRGLLQLATVGNRAGRWQAFRALRDLLPKTNPMRLQQVAHQVPGSRRTLAALRRGLSPDSWVAGKR